MKRFVAILILAVASRALGDGTVQFQNSKLSLINIYDYATLTTNPVTPATLGSQDGTGISSGVLDVGLVWGTSATSVNTLAGIENMSSTIAGEVAGNFVYSVAGTIPGDQYYFQVFAWDSSYGDSLAGMNACVSAGGYFAAATGTPGVYGSIGAPLEFLLESPQGPPTPIFGFPGEQGYFHGFTVNLATPEPGTIALTGLGAAAILLFRRWK